MRVKLFSSLAFLLCFVGIQTVFAQSYWQQEVDYYIEVSLDDQNKKLNAKQWMEYHNHSPHDLNELYIHVYPNAYANKQTAFAKQQLRNKNRTFASAKEEDMGYIQGLNFVQASKGKQEGLALKWSFTEDIDIVKIDLSDRPLKAGQSISIFTDFEVKIPKVFSRMGYEKDVFQISQWHPKMAVYDVKGWHPMPYLDQGEFYGEFANYEVLINVPEDYVVLATGEVGSGEFLWMHAMATGQDMTGFEKQDSGRKNVIYNASQVHDFAWFASKQWELNYTSWISPDGMEVDVWTANLKGSKWSKAAEYTIKTLDYLSEHVGTYPYPQVTVLEGDLKAGGGMEYPMITVIQKGMTGSSLEQVIVHEVGHNWFYGILASNERDYPWMDESINSYYENKITKKDKLKTSEKGFSGDEINDLIIEKALIDNSKTANSQAITSHAEDFIYLNYGLDIYMRAPKMLAYLEEYLGEENFKSMMRAYFEEWKFKHPQPEDLQASWKKHANKDIDWFFEWLDQASLGDVAVSKKRGDVYKLSNKTGIANFPIKLMVGNEVNWYQFAGKDTLIHLPNIDKKAIYIDKKMDDVSVNNYAKRNFVIRPLAGIGKPENETVYITPVLGGNAHDGFMLGLGAHNYGLPTRKFQFHILPAYAFKSKDIVGMADFKYNFWNVSENVKHMRVGLKGASYHFSNRKYEDQIFAKRFVKIMPYLDLDLKQDHAHSLWKHSFHVAFDVIGEDHIDYVFDEIRNEFIPDGTTMNFQSYLKFNYQSDYGHALNPVGLQFNALGNGDIAKFSAEAKVDVSYMLKKQKASMRVFAGWMWFNKSKYSYLPQRYQWATTFTSMHDFTYDEIFLARNERLSFIQNQIFMRDGGFKTPSSFYANPIGISDSWLIATNFTFDIPKLPILPVRVYADFSMYPNKFASSNDPSIKTSYALGLELYAGDFFSVYFPLLMDKEFRDYKKHILNNKYGRTITFKMNLKAFKLSNWRNLSF